MKNVFCEGKGDPEIFRLLNNCWKMIDGMNGTPGLRSLCDPGTKAFMEGGKWKGIWSQNYMGMYTWAPFLDDTLFSAHDNAYNYFFEFQGNGVRSDKAGMIAPSGALSEHIFFADGKTPAPHYKNDEHTGKASEYDFWIEGTCGTVIGKTDALLVRRNIAEIKKYLPLIEASLGWIENLRDPAAGLIKAGPAGTFIERSYSGTDLGNGKFSYAFPSGVMVYYIKALRNTVELEKIAGTMDKAQIYAKHIEKSISSIKKLFADEGYFISYLDAKGVKHGVYGAEKHGYFESNPNHDAIAYRVTDDEMSESIYRKIVSIPELRKGGTINCVYPRRDDVLPGYQSDPAYGPGPGYHWHGASWFSSEARMLMAYYRLNKFRDVKNSLGRMFELYAKGYTRDVMDNFGTEFAGSYNPEEKGIAYIDGFAVYGAGLRGLFEYEYTAESLMLHPHVPNGITEYRQLVPARFGDKKIYPSVFKTGKNKNMMFKINGGKEIAVEKNCIELKYLDMKNETNVEIYI